MSKKRGLSMDDKREQLLQIFYETQDFFLLRELEKLGPRKGVISQTVKDVVQSLVDDDLVSKDKIGTSISGIVLTKKSSTWDFWSLPSRAGQQLRSVRSKLENELLTTTNQRTELEKKMAASSKGREDSDERDTAFAAMKEIEERHKTLKNEMELYADNDPVVIEGMKTATGVAHQAVNRWTDNIFSMQNWCSNNFPEAKDRLQHAYKEVGITDDFDYLE